MKTFASTFMPTPITANSQSQASYINNMQASLSKAHGNTSTSKNTVATSSQQSTATIKVVTNQLSADEQLALEKDLKDRHDFHKKQETSAADMVSETQRILAEVAKEQPSLLNKKFDFTNTGDEIDIIKHDLSEREYNYLKAKLNASDKLVEATDFLNVAAARNKSSTSISNTKYTKEDLVGRIHVRDIIEQAKERSAERIRISEQNIVTSTNNTSSMFRKEVHLNALDLVLSNSVGLNAKA